MTIHVTLHDCVEIFAARRHASRCLSVIPVYPNVKFLCMVAASLWLYNAAKLYTVMGLND